MITMRQLSEILRKNMARTRKRVLATYRSRALKSRVSSPIALPDCIRQDLQGMNSIEYRVISSGMIDRQNIVGYLRDHALDYVRLSLATSQRHYDLIITIKNLRTGGTQKLLLHYLQGIQNCAPHLRIALLVLEGQSCPWEAHIPKNTELFYYQKYCLSSFNRQQYAQILTRFIVQYNIKVLWNFNCRETYDFSEDNPEFIRNKVIVWGLVFAHWLRSDTLQEIGMAHECLPVVINDYDLVIADNQTFVDYLCQQYGWAKEQFRTLYIPLSPEPLLYRKNSIKSEMKVLWASGFESNKGVTLLPEIAQRIAHLPISIDVYGGVKNQSAEALLLKFNKDILFKKNISYKGEFTDFSSVVNRGDYGCFLFTSWVEGMPNVVVEAAEKQLPIVTPLVGGLSEFLDKHNAYIVTDKRTPEDYANQLEAVYMDYKVGNLDKLKYLTDSYNDKFTLQKFQESFLPIMDRYRWN